MARRAAGSCLRPDVALRARRRRRGHLPAGLAARHRGTAPLSRLLLSADVPPSLRLRRLDDARRLFLVRGPPALRILLGRLGPPPLPPGGPAGRRPGVGPDRKSTRLNSSHQIISYAVFCLKKKKIIKYR